LGSTQRESLFCMSAESSSTEKPVQLPAYRFWLQGKTRIWIAWIFAFWFAFSARELPTWPGVLVCFLGASLRYWASGFLRKDTRPAVGGPYAWVRNPLYLGTYLMALGTAASIHAYVLLLVMSVVFGGLYHFIILDEETKLKVIFNKPYLKYLELVPRFIPFRIPRFQDLQTEVNPDPEAHHFSHTLATKNKAYEAYVSWVGLIGGAALIAWLWQKWV
jgi:hypothetical protein